MWLWSISTDGEPILSQGKVKLSSKNAFTSILVTNLFKLKILHPVGFDITYTKMGVSRSTNVFGRGVLTNGSWKRKI